jgi:hypothetical protein
VWPEVRAGIPAVAYQRKARNRCNHFIDRAPTTLSKMLSSTRPRDGRGVERQRRRFERAKNGLKPDCSRVGRFLQWASNSTCAVRCQQRGRSLHRVPPHIANDDEQFLPLSWIVIVPGQTTTTGHRPVAPFEPTEVKIVDRQDDAVVVCVPVTRRM